MYMYMYMFMFIAIIIYTIIAIAIIHYCIQKRKHHRFGVLYTSYHPDTYSFVSNPTSYIKEWLQHIYTIGIALWISLHGILASGLFVIVVFNHLVEDPLFYSPISLYGSPSWIQWSIAIPTLLLAIGHSMYLYYYLDVFFSYHISITPSHIHLYYQIAAGTPRIDITTINTTSSYNIQPYTIDIHEGVYKTVYAISQHDQTLCIEHPRIETKHTHPHWTTTTIPYTVRCWRSKGISAIEQLLKK